MPKERTHGEIQVILFALMLAMLLAALDQTIVSTALPRIASELNGLTKLSWVATAYLITSAIATPLYGKISDQLGRKKVFQSAIAIFLVGSILCGLSQNMNQLVLFRAIQGIGGGGLMSLALTIIGDVVPPRQRGRYQGYFGAVFGFSSVVGPLLGGFFTDSLSWRWIFYINLPLGIMAMSAISSRLHLPVHKREHKIDYLGAGLLSASVSALILATVWGGVTYAWGSATILSLIGGGSLLAIVFAFWETKAKEPIIPPSLFKSDIFTVSTILALLAGIAMFASILYIPEYQQVVRGYSPTKSGLLMLPLMVGLLGASMTSGRLISKYGKYRKFPIIGTLLMTVGLWLFSHLTLTTHELTVTIWMLVLGAGLGGFMQVMTLAIQNSVDRQHLGAATASVTFFRSIGASFGGAIFGTILINRFNEHIQALMPAGTSINAHILQSGTAQLHTLPPVVQHNILDAFVHSFRDLFSIAIIFTLAAFVVALFLRETPLRTSISEHSEGVPVK